MCHKLGGFSQQKFIGSPFWRLEVQTQGCRQSQAPSEAARGESFLAPIASDIPYLLAGYSQSLTVAASTTYGPGKP